MLALSDYQASPDLICSLYSSSVQLDLHCLLLAQVKETLLFAASLYQGSEQRHAVPFFLQWQILMTIYKQKQPHGVVLPVKWQMGSNV